MRNRVIIGAAAALLVFSLTVSGQESRGTILGRVTDASGGVVTIAEIKAINTATGVTVSAKANDSGNYVLPYLVSGFYNVTAEASGFKTFLQESVQVRVNERVEINITMTVGAITEKIE